MQKNRNSMHTKIFRYPLAAALLILMLPTLITSCRKDNVCENPAPQQEQNEIANLKNFIAKVVQDDPEHIRFDQQKNAFIIAGDVVMPLDDARLHYQKSKELPAEDAVNEKPAQRRYTYVMSATAAANIWLYVDGTVPADWKTAINQAIGNWNSTGSRIRIQGIRNSAANISFSTYYEAGNTIAFASFPGAGGAPGSTVTINTKFNTLTASQKQFAITHELGHCFGFTHTNQSFGAVIPGTPVTDPNSVMNSTVLNWNGFTQYDLIAFRTVYP